jgi:DNA-binding MarR family transcriptional regulator
MKVDYMTVYNRLQQIHVLLDDGDRRSLSDLDLSTPQYNLLLHLYTKGTPENGLTITELADLLICTRSNATRLVQRLEQQGLVQLGSDSADRRLVRVFFTPAGTDIVEKARAAHLASVKRRLGALKPEDLDQLDQLTQSIVAALETDLANLGK